MNNLNRINSTNVLRWTHLFWFAEIALNINYLPLSIEEILGIIVVTILGIICFVFYEKKIGKIIACGFIGLWLIDAIVTIYGIVAPKYGINSSIIVHMDWTLSYGIANIISITFVLCIPLIQLFQNHIKDKAKIFVSIVIFLGSAYILYWCFGDRDKLYYKELKQGRAQVEEIEEFYTIHGHYPDSLSQLTYSEGFYNLSEDGHSYTVERGFDHWYNRYHTNSCIFTFESIIYDSNKKKWTHKRP